MALSKKDKVQLVVIATGLLLMITIGYINYKKMKDKKIQAEQKRQEAVEKVVEVKAEASKPAQTAGESSPTNNVAKSIAQIPPKVSTVKKQMDQSLLQSKLLSQKHAMDLPWGKDPFFNVPKIEPVQTEALEPLNPITPIEEASGDQIEALEKIILKGISQVGTKYIAMINRDICQIGDVVGGFHIESISSNRLILKKDGKIYEKFIQ